MKITIEIEPEEAAKFFNEFVPKYELGIERPVDIWSEWIKNYDYMGNPFYSSPQKETKE